MSIGKRSIIWNIIGSAISAGSSFILLFCVTRAVGVNEGGIFSLAFATAQLLLTVGKYGVRSFQATDVSEEVPFFTYLVTRAVFCIFMIVFAFLYVVISGFDVYKAAVILSVCLLKMIDAVEDVFHGQLQLSGRMDIAGMLLAFRSLFTICLFGVIIFVSRMLLFSCFFTAVVSTLICLLANVPVVRHYGIKLGRWSKSQGIFLIKACTPLFLGQFLSLYIYNTPKYAIDRYCVAEVQTYYAIIFMPAFVINLFSEFVFKPLLTSLAEWWHENKIDEFGKLVKKLIVNIGIITAVILCIMYLCGIPILSFVYGMDLQMYRNDLMILLIGGGFSAAVYFSYNVLTAMRMQKDILLDYVLGAVFVTAIAYYAVKIMNIRGASLSYLISEIVLFILMIGTIAKGINKRK